MTTPHDLNRLCAEQMGWREFPYAPEPNQKPRMLLPNTEPHADNLWPIPDYCGSIAAAFSLIQLTDHFQTERGLVGGVWRWRAELMGTDGVWHESGLADTAPLAIARAFLASRGVRL